MVHHLSTSGRCRICGNHLDVEDHFCSNCGTEVLQADPKAAAPRQFASVYSFRCDDCGAAMSYDASAQALRCPFCGSLSMTRKADTRVLRPDAVVPFQVSRQAAEEILRRWIHEGFWRPSDIRQQAMVQAIAAVFVPYWVFSARTETHWTADSSSVPMGARGNWVPVSGDHHGEYEGLLVGASSSLTPAETTDIAPFDLRKGVEPETVDLLNMRVEEFQMPRRLARPLATGALQELERQACRRYVSGECRNMRVNVRVLDMYSTPVLLPVWIMAFRYKKQVYRVLINGQTGKLSGGAPFAYGKLALILGGVVILLAIIIFFIFLAGGFR